jgi:hypothetical protein
LAFFYFFTVAFCVIFMTWETRTNHENGFV